MNEDMWIDVKPVKLTKAALNDFIRWSTSRYNNYCGYGTKNENVDTIFKSLKAGCYVDWKDRHDENKKVFIIECASSVGESGNGRYWKTKQNKAVIPILLTAKH